LCWTDLTLLAIDPTQTTYAADAGAFISFTVPLVIGSFDFCNNQLEGAFYSGWLTAAWPNIVSFSICNNKISGPIPSDLWSLPSPKLALLDFSGNMWSGDFPSGTRHHNSIYNHSWPLAIFTKSDDSYTTIALFFAFCCCCCWCQAFLKNPSRNFCFTPIPTLSTI